MKIKNVRSPNLADDNSLVDPCRRDDENVAATVASNEQRNSPALAKFLATIPTLKPLKHVSNVAYVWRMRLAHKL